MAFGEYVKQVPCGSPMHIITQSAVYSVAAIWRGPCTTRGRRRWNNRCLAADQQRKRSRIFVEPSLADTHETAALPPVAPATDDPPLVSVMDG